MSELDPCAFCNIDTLADRVIRIGSHTVSLLSKPAYRPGHALVMPRRHITELSELLPKESIELLSEAGRVASLLDTGFGSELHQKFAPLQAGNGVRMAHLHLHVVPKLETDAVFGIPDSLTDFYTPADEELERYLDLLR